MNVTLKDFQPFFNNWEPERNGNEWGDGTPKWIVDKSTGRKYLNEDINVTRSKCLLLTLGTPFVHPLASVANIIYRLAKILTFSHFWMVRNEKEYNFKARLADCGLDLLRIVITPIAIIGLELSAIYGIVNPLDGRKLYASIERLVYYDFLSTFGFRYDSKTKHLFFRFHPQETKTGFLLAPCFQPDPKFHLFGGDIKEKNAF